MGFTSCFKEGRHLSNKHKKFLKKQQRQSESMDREIKWFVTIVLLAFAVIGAMPYFSMMLGGVVQYAEGAEFYIQPNDFEFVHHDGAGTSCPTVTGPSSADNNVPPSSKEWYISDSADPQGCYYPVYIFDEERIIPRVFDDAISLANRLWMLTDWANPNWNTGDNIGGGTNCYAMTLDDADPRINATAAYDAIRSQSSIGFGEIGDCESDISETEGVQIHELRVGVAVEDYVNRENSTYWAFGGRLGSETSSRDGGDRSIDSTTAHFRLKATFQVPANYSNNWWQLQEHPMFINELGTPTGNQFSDNSPALIDSGFFGIDDTTFTMDTGLDAVERGQVVLFKQFNKTTIGERDIRVQGGIQSVDALGDTRLRIEVRDHALQAGQTQWFGKGLDTNLENDVHDGQDYFHKNRPIKYINNGSLGVLDFEPTSLGTVEGFDFSLSPEWTHSTNDIFTVVIAVQDNSTTGSLIANITSVEIEDVINYNFQDINDLLFWEDGCSTNFANVEPTGSDGTVMNDENCGDDLSNGFVNINNQTLTGAIAGTLSTPAAVTGLTVGVITDDSLILEWTHDGIDTTGYRIDRDDGSGMVEYIPNTAVGGPNGEGGLYENRFIDINYNVTAYPSRANAIGLDDNTQYSYRVCALNGDLVGTCSSTVSATTPDSEPFWQIVEFDEDNTGAGILMSHTGGDGDWIEMESGLTQTGNFDGYMLKSFNITEYGFLERNSIPTFYIDWQEIGSGNVQVMYCDGEFNRFNTTIFRIGDSANDQCTGGVLSALDGYTWKDNFVFGGSGAFKPELQSFPINLNSTYFASDFVTVMFTIRDVSSIDNKGFQIKNFTWTNSTTWNFESGNGANMNWTARINVDEENGESASSYASPLYANCRYSGGFEDRYIDHTYDCDEGTIKAVTSTHTITPFTEEANDWQYYETNGIEATGLGFASFSSNATGLYIDNAESTATNLPDHYSKQFIWKKFSKSVLQDGNITATVEGINGPDDSPGITTGLTVMNDTSSTGITFELDRWNSEQYGENNVIQAGGPSPFNYCAIILKDPNSCIVKSLDFNGNLTARDGEVFSPFDPITVTGDFSSFQTTDNIYIVLQTLDNGGTTSGTALWYNVTVGGTTYNFSNSNVKAELGETQFERISDGGTLNYQKYTGVLGADRGLISPGSLIVEPPDPPTNLNATADIADVILNWTASVGADDYKIERADVDVNATNFSVIVPSLVDANIEFLSDDFSSYPTNASGDLVWIPTKAGSGSADDIIGVNATGDNLHFHANIASASNVEFDLFNLLGQNLTDASGVGDFNMTWTHQLLAHETAFADTGELKVTLTDRITTPTGTQTGIQVGFFHREAGFTQSGLLRVAEDNSGFLGFDAVDTNCGDGSTTFVDVSPDDNIADTPITVYETLSKVGQVLTYNVGINDDYGGLGCTMSTTATETFDDLRYLKISRANSGSSQQDSTFTFDDFAISINGTLVTFYYDRDVELGTNYNYKVRALNTEFATESDPSNIASVLTNNVPDDVTGIESEFATVNQIDIQWDALAFNSGIGEPSTGLNLTKYQVFRENVTGGTDFELISEIFASSPPNNFYNDTGVSFPSVFNYQVSGCNAVGCGGNSTTSQASVTDPPGAVLDTPVFNATAVNNSVSLDWNDASFAINYTVLRNGTIIAQGVPSSDYIDTSQALDTNYVYSAWGVNNNGNGTEGFSNAVITNDIPTEPLNFTVSMGLVSPYLETPILNWTFPLDQGDGDPSTSVPILNFTVERKQGIGAFTFLKNETSILQNGTTDDTAVVAANYTWKVQACNIVGCSPFSNTFSLIVTPTTVPNQVPSLTADTLSGTEIFLDWVTPSFNASNQPTEYRIQQRHVGFTGFVTLLDTGNLDTEYTVTGLLPGNTYDYRVAGLSGAGQGNYSNIAQNTTFTVPSQPLAVNATSLSQTEILLEWLEPAQTNGAILNYSIEQAGSPFIFIGNTSGTNFTATGLTTKTIYDFRVNATNLIGSGAYSLNATNTTFGVPDPPINLAGSTDGINEVTIEWDEPLLNYGSEVIGYRIDQAEGIGGTFITAINNTGNNVEPLEETFAGLLPQTDYVFRIFAYNGFGISPASANLTQGTIIGPSEPQNVFAVFNSTKPYSVFISWETPASDGGKAISGYLVQRKDTAGIFQQIANITDPSILNYTDTSLINLATHTYRVAAYSNPTGSFSPDQDVATVVPANIVNYTITSFKTRGDVLRQDYEFIVDDCFPSCALTQADIERNGIVESNIPFNTPVPLDTTITFTTWFILPDTSLSSINTTAFITNLGSSEDDETGATLTSAEFLVPSSLYFNHTRTSDFELLNFTLIRHPVTWDATCEYQNGAGFGVGEVGERGIQPPISLQNVGFYDDQLDVVPSLNTYVACFDPIDNQILSFTSFGLGNGSLALVSFTSQLGDFMGVPVPFIFIIFLAAIWTGRSASTGIIFLAVAIGAMGVLGYFPGLDDQPLLAGTFWSLIVLLTALGVLVGKRFF